MDEVDSWLLSLASGTAGAAGDDSCCVGAPASTLSAFRKVFERGRKAFETVQVARASTHEASAELLHVRARASECEANVAIASKQPTTQGLLPLKDARNL